MYLLMPGYYDANFVHKVGLITMYVSTITVMIAVVRYMIIS
jgi:hypothetical protein